MFSKVMLFVIGAFVIGVVVAGFVFSQAPGTIFSTTPPASGVYHSPDQVVCNGCIVDSNVATIASISPQKINGVNGRFIHYNTASTTPSILSGSDNMGILDWHGKIIETVCGLGSIRAGVSSMTFIAGTNGGGQITQYTKDYNHYVNYLVPITVQGNGVSGLPGFGWVPVYSSDIYNWGPQTPVSSTKLFIKVSDTNSAQLIIGETVSGTTNTAIGDCLIKYVGLWN